MILVDTSVWIDHLNRSDYSLSWHLEQGLVLMHPFITGELACGNLRNRQALLILLQQLPRIATATDTEVMYFIDRHSLMGKGIGYIDAHLLAAVAIDGTARLWTRDQRLQQTAETLGIATLSSDQKGNLHEDQA